MGIDALILNKLNTLSEDQQYAVLGYIEHLLVNAAQDKPFPLTRLEDGLGCVNYQGARKSDAEMQQGILAEAKRQWQQGNRI
ncbi:MAG: hypothetical protein AAF512_02480 [Pseudomonadota bacterium]